MKENAIIYDDKYFVVISPNLPLNCRDDGGHLLLLKKKAVRDRSDLSWQEAVDFMRITMVVGKAMYEVLGIERMNYEDLGNWGVDEPGGPKMHLHFFGRARQQIHQIRGQHMFCYPQGHPIYDGHLKPFTRREVRALTGKVAEIMHEEKYRKMAELAGIE